MDFLTPFIPYISLISVFCITYGAAKILPRFPPFYLPMTSIHAGPCDDRHCEKDGARSGVPEKIGTLKSLVVSRCKPQPPAWQGSALSIVLCPLGRNRHENVRSSQEPLVELVDGPQS